jgi:hypothetical protein
MGVKVDDVPGIRVGPCRFPLAAAAATAADEAAPVWNFSSNGLIGMLRTREDVFW